jgi:hypothetical protein
VRAVSFGGELFSLRGSWGRSKGGWSGNKTRRARRLLICWALGSWPASSSACLSRSATRGAVSSAPAQSIITAASRLTASLDY